MEGCNDSATQNPDPQDESHINTHNRPLICSEKLYLLEHQKIHAKNRPYKCGICHKSFQQKRNLLLHMRLHIGEKLRRCHMCEMEFNDGSQLLRHTRTHIGEIIFRCNFCGKNFMEDNSLQRHTRKYHQEGFLLNDCCGQSFKQNCHLQDHIRKNTGDGCYTCELCGTDFLFYNDLQMHQTSHKVEKCVLGLTEVCKVNMCQERHMKEQQSPCNIHSKTLAVHLSAHKDLHQQESKEETVPKTCEILHEPVKLYKCGICNLGFNAQGHLLEHMRIHTVENSCTEEWQFDAVSQNTTERSTFQGEIILHWDDKRHECDVCGRTFTFNNHLQVHKRTHTGEKPFKCDICGANFAQTSNLNSHKITHTNEKPYSCNICDKKFARSYALKRHKAIHEEEEDIQE